MKLKYTIYWFEDDLGYINRRETRRGINDLKTFLEEENGFVMDMVFYSSSGKIPKSMPDLQKYVKLITDYKNTTLRQEVDFQDVDLIIMDYNLGSEKGDQIINYIRDNQNDIYTDIFFYSERKSEKELRELSDKDGLYCSNRDELFSADKIKKVIKTTIKKAQDLNNLRGLVMAETSELDEMIRDILKLIKKNSKVEKNRILKIKAELIEKNSASKKTIEEFSLPKDFDELIDSLFVNAGFALDKLLNFAKCNRNNLAGKEFSGYKKIQKIRNNLAHKVERVDDSKIMIDGEEYDEKKFTDIRKNIQKYKNIFQEIIDDLNKSE